VINSGGRLKEAALFLLAAMVIISMMPGLAKPDNSNSSLETNESNASQEYSAYSVPLNKTQADNIALDMCSFPSNQGWAYSALGNNLAETQIFSIQGSGQNCILHQDSMNAGTASQGGNNYQIDKEIDPSKPFVVKVKAKVLAESPTVSAGPNHFGFGFIVGTTNGGFGIGLGTNTIQDLNNNIIVENTNNWDQFHEYKLECDPVEGYKFYIDNHYTCSGMPRDASTIGYINKIFLGDCTGGTNAIADVAGFEFIQGPSKLDMCSLPSSQGWTYVSPWNTRSEADAFSIHGSGQGCYLYQNTMGIQFQNQDSNAYIRYDVVDPTKPFEIKIRAKILQEQMASGSGYVNHYGFCFGAGTGTEDIGIGLGTDTIMATEGEGAHRILATGQNNGVFHDYMLTVSPVTGYSLYVDGDLLESGSPRIGEGQNRIYFGDCTGGSNAEAEIESFEFIQENSAPHSNLNVDVSCLNTILKGEHTPISIRVTQNSQPVVADVVLKINNEVVYSGTSSDYTYTFPLLPSQKSEGCYNLDIEANYRGLTARKVDKILVIGGISKSLALAENLYFASNLEMNKAEDLAVTRLVRSEMECGVIIIKNIFQLAINDRIGYIVKKIIPAEVYVQLDLYLSKIEHATLSVFKESSGLGSKALIGFTNLEDKIKKLTCQRVEDDFNIKLYRAFLTARNQILVDYIMSNPQKFQDTMQEKKFVYCIQNLNSIVRTKPIYPSSPLGVTMFDLTAFYDAMTGCLDLLSSIILPTIIIFIVIVVIFVAGGGIVISIPAIISLLGVAGSAVAQTLGSISAIVTSIATTKFILAIFLILSIPTVCNYVVEENAGSIRYIIDQPELQSPSVQINSQKLFIHTNDAIIGQSIRVSSNSYAMIVSPDGRFSGIVPYCGDYISDKPGTYKAMAYQQIGNITPKSLLTSFQVLKPNITLSTSCMVQGNIALVNLQLKNREPLEVKNLTTMLGIRNSTGGIAFSSGEFFSLNAGESKNISYTIDLKERDIYTATAILSLGFLEILEDRSFSIKVGVQTVEDAAIINVDHMDEYSPFDNININLTIQSYAPDLALNISIPKLNFTTPVILTGMSTINLTLSKLPPDDYVIGILAERHGKVLDSKIINFYVKAEGVGILTFNTSQLVYPINKSTALNLSLKDLNLTDVDALVGINVIGPSGAKKEIPLTSVSGGYRFNFIPPVNGTYLLEAYAFKEGWHIENNTLSVIVGQMSPLEMNISFGDDMLVNIFENGIPSECKVTLYSKSLNTSTITSDGNALLNFSNDFYLVVDKMFFEPASFSYIKGKLAMNVTADHASSYPGAIINFTLKITNTGNWTDDKVHAIDILPNGLDYISDNRSGSVSGRIVSWNDLGPLDIGESTFIRLVAKVIKGSPAIVINEAESMGFRSLDESNQLGSYASAQSKVEILAPEIMVEKSVEPRSSAPGAKINFTIKVSNIGNFTLNPVKVIDQLPVGLSYISDNKNGYLYGRNITWDSLGPLNIGDSTLIMLITRIDQNASGNLTNLVEATGTSTEMSEDVSGSATSIIRVLQPSIKVEKTIGLQEPIQYSQLCDNQKISGTGKMDVGTSIIDKNLALDYQTSMVGDGDVELDSEIAVSEKSSKLQRSVDNNTTYLNLYDSTKMTYSGETPLSGGKYLESKEFFGGIGAIIQEAFSVNEMEKDQQTFFASTDPTSNEVDPNKIDQLRNASSTHLVALETKNTFNGTWGTDASWHKIFYKDINAHEMFTGTFEADKLIKFHENPVPEKEHNACEEIDC
jgi:uncharacterized repeat protein (TIGR01451 family)